MPHFHAKNRCRRYLLDNGSVLIGVLCILLPVLSIAATTKVSHSTFQLSHGVVIDANAGSAYVVAKDDSVVSLDIQTGTEKWHSTKFAEPIGIAQGSLVAHLKSSVNAAAIQMVLLDARDGHVTTQATVPLSLAGNVSIANAIQLNVVTSTSQQPAITWQYQERHRGGRRPGDASTYLGKTQGHSPGASADSDEKVNPQPPAAKSKFGDLTRFGAFTLDVNTGQALLMSQTVAADLILKSSERVAVVSDSSRFASADGEHYVISKRVGGDMGDQKYEWTIFSTVDNSIVGKILAPASNYPYFVIGTQLIYDEPRISRSSSNGHVTKPRTLRAFDLKTGSLAWEHELKEYTATGQVPP